MFDRIAVQGVERYQQGRTAQKNTADEGGVQYQAKPSTKNPNYLDPKTVTKSDVIKMLNLVADGTVYGNTYILVRIKTPSVLIYWALKKRGDVIDNNPIAISAEKAYNAMNRLGTTETGRPNALSVDEIVAMIEAMNDPRYIVYQGANDRYVEVVEFGTKTGSKAFAVIEIGNDKDAVYMNGYEGGLYNILVTTFPPKAGKIKELLANSQNEVVYDKKKDAPQRTSSNTVPSVLNDASFFEDIIFENGTIVNNNISTVPESAYQIQRRRRTDALSNREVLERAYEVVDRQKITDGRVRHRGIPPPSGQAEGL